MRRPDFLHKDAETPLREYYEAAGAVCGLSTNCEPLMEAARDSFLRVEIPQEPVDFSLRLWVDHTDRAQPPWPKPYVRGLDHLVFAGFDSGSSIVTNLRTRQVIGRFSAGMAGDTKYWGTVIFPMLLTIVSASLGIAELHCACVSQNLDGILLAGPSRSGKSTLALALSQIGCGFLSDDRAFCSFNNGEMCIWGLPTRLKLRSEAAAWFHELQHIQPTAAQAGENELWFDPEEVLGLNRIRRCRARSLIFLERQEASGFRLSRMPSNEAVSRLNKELMAELPDAITKRSETIAKLVDIPFWLLRYGGQPHTIARNILQHLARFQ
jgi:hypothetical protein